MGLQQMEGIVRFEGLTMNPELAQDYRYSISYVYRAIACFWLIIMKPEHSGEGW